MGCLQSRSHRELQGGFPTWLWGSCGALELSKWFSLQWWGLNGVFWVGTNLSY